MFEVVLATIETKLQRVENLDRAVHHLMRKMDMMERKLSNKDADVLAAVQALEKQTSEAHVSVKLNQLSAKLDNLCDDNVNSIEEENDVNAPIHHVHPGLWVVSQNGNLVWRDEGSEQESGCTNKVPCREDGQPGVDHE